MYEFYKRTVLAKIYFCNIEESSKILHINFIIFKTENRDIIVLERLINISTKD